jgi:hypothetical protein
MIVARASVAHTKTVCALLSKAEGRQKGEKPCGGAIANESYSERRQVTSRYAFILKAQKRACFFSSLIIQHSATRKRFSCRSQFPMISCDFDEDR